MHTIYGLVLTGRGPIRIFILPAQPATALRPPPAIVGTDIGERSYAYTSAIVFQPKQNRTKTVNLNPCCRIIFRRKRDVKLCILSGVTVPPRILHLTGSAAGAARATHPCVNWGSNEWA